jgi:hypothetical protein
MSFSSFDGKIKNKKKIVLWDDKWQMSSLCCYGRINDKWVPVGIFLDYRWVPRVFMGR